MNEQELDLESTLARLRSATLRTKYENQIYLVGGLPRDRALGLPLSNDLDLVLEGDATALATFLYEQGLSQHYPVLYPRFGTAMIHIGNAAEPGYQVELVTARAEAYQPDSRKPDVVRGTLEQDAFRRDFTINTLMENLHTGEVLDLTGRAKMDLSAGIIRTPREPLLTFFDDPLRMLRAVRFASRFDFEIERETLDALTREAERLRPPAISSERIRDEFVKIIKLPGTSARRGLELLLKTGLLEQFLPEMLPMVGCTQGGWHPYDVWEHSLQALKNLPESASLNTRLGMLWHDLAKPLTRTEDERGVHFYGHQNVGEQLVHTVMNRLKFSNEDIRDVSALVGKHMRLGEYKPNWSDAPVKRLIRDAGDYLAQLFTLCEGDMSAMQVPDSDRVNLPELRARINQLNALTNVAKITSPLDGRELMEALAVGEGSHLRDAKEYLINEIIEGHLQEGDKTTARDLIHAWWRARKGTDANNTGPH